MMNLVEDCSEKFPQGRFRILSNEEQGRCVTFELIEEDHTLGNALRHMLAKNPDVKFCGYALPHPNERKISFQVQVVKGTAIEALEKGFKDLLSLTQVVRAKIQESADLYGSVPLENSEDEDEETIERLTNWKTT